MNSRPVSWPRACTICLALMSVMMGALIAQDADPEEVKEKNIADQFVKVLEKSPRRGTALDKVYGFHVERGSLDGLIKAYREKAQSANAGPTWMIIGLLESLRGQDAAAVTAFEQVEKLSPENYLASYYLGQSLILVGQPDKAAEALERAVERKPAQADLLDVYQALGRVYQRAQKADKALDVWNRLEKQFPNDIRVQEQIATTLLEENEYAAALPRYESLAKNTKDKYRQSLFQMEAADIKVRLGQSAEAIKEFETLLGQLLPENWLYREVRRRIETVYLRTDDQAGLIAYYETWLKKSPQDLEVISRLSRLLAGYGRTAEAQKWLENGLKLAPKKKELRQALITQFVYDHKYSEAIAQYEQLDKYEPNNPDTLREWGRLILKDSNREEAVRKAGAVAVWNRMTAAKPKDPFVVSQVAELFRQAEMTDAALEQYKKAVALAPDQSQYREYLGEYFHALKRKEEALATWRGIADGKQKTAPNLARLAEVLASFGYVSEAVEANGEACKLDPKDFALQLKQVDLLAQANKHDEAIEQLTKVKALAANDEEREAWLMRDLRELQAADKLKDKIESLAKDDQSKEADHWFWLARAYETERKMKDASAAISTASNLAPQSVPILTAAGRIQEAQNNLLAAVEINTKLAAIDRRYRTEYLKQVATLEQKLGRRDKAIQAGRDLIAAAPGNPELYEFFSQLCFQLGETEEGLGALRRSVRVNPADAKGLLLLASALSEQFRTSEAIELYWRAFDKAPNLDDRLGIIPRLTELYLQTNQLDRLLERLERQRREPNQQREMTICIAQAHQSAGDDGNARQELEKLLTDDSRDAQLLTQLTKLCESDGDLDAAIRFQQQLLKATPGREATMRLAQLMLKSGESEEATTLISQLTVDEKDPEAVLKSLDSMLNQGNYEQAFQIADKLTRDQPTNWELLYREGIALTKTKPKGPEAKARFEAILALKLDDDEMTLSAKNQLKKAQAQSGGRTRGLAQFAQLSPLFSRAQASWQVRQSVGLDNQNFGGQQQQPVWIPHDFGTARMACLGWLDLFARNESKEDEFLQQQREQAEKSEDRRVLLDWYYLASLTNNSKETYGVMKRLSMRPDADIGMKSLYLSSLTGRGYDATQDDSATAEQPATASPPGSPQAVQLTPLKKDELEHVLACYRSIGDTDAMMNFGETFLQIVAAELSRSGRKDEADKMLKDALASAQTAQQIAVQLSAAIQRDDFENAMTLLDRIADLKSDTANQLQNPSGFNYAQYLASPAYQSQILAQLMAKRAQQNALQDVLSLWDRNLVNAVAARNQQTKVPTATKRKAQQQVQYQPNGYVLIWRGNSQRYENLDFPTPNDIYDQAMIQMLRQAFVIYKDADQLKSLVDHFQQKLEDPKTPEGQKIFWQFGSGYLSWWQDDKDGALSVLTAATESLPDNQEMRFELARLHEKRGEHDVALGLIDSLPATDQQTVQKREIAALRLAVNSGNIDRARTAAERLFGLRLDSNLQIQLSQQMNQLGMHEQAEAILARAGRQAGNKTDVLANLMQQYQSQGKNEVATQIAHQLLRRSGNGAMPGGRNVQRSNDGNIRQQALTVLKRSGKLPEMIGKVEAQLKNSPKSQRLLESLLEYYTANGDDKKIAELTEKVAESKQDDPQFHYNLAQQLVNQGKFKEAVEHYKLSLKKDSKLLQNNFWQVMNAFQNANKVDELFTLFDDVDLKAFRQNPWELANTISNLAQQEKFKLRAVELFKRAWKDLPDQRQQLLQYTNNEVFWQMPEIYDYARQGLIPTETSILQSGGWPGFGQIQNYGNEGKITTLISRFLTIAKTNQRLDELAKEVEDAQKKVKKWDGGAALLGMINLRRGRVEEGKQAFEKLLPNIKQAQQQQNVGWEVGQELMSHEACVELAIQYLEYACKSPDSLTMNGFQLSPGRPLVNLYKQRGRKDDARRLLLEGSRARGQTYPGNEGYEAYRRIENVNFLSNEMKSLGYPVDSLRICQEQLGRSDDFVAITQWYGGGSNGSQQADRMKKQVQTNFDKALKDLRPELLPELLASSREVKPNAANPAGTDVANSQESAVDLLLLLESRELNKTEMTSALGKLVDGLTKRPEMIAQAREALATVREKAPKDFAVLILTVQLAQTSNDASAITASVRDLVALMEQTPLESAPAKGGFTPKQRDAAMQQAALWLVARNCLKQEAHRAEGQKLGARALEAARRQADNGFALAILREWGQVALDVGDKATAEERWTEMLDAVVPKSVEKPKKAEDPKTSINEPLKPRAVFALRANPQIESESPRRDLSSTANGHSRHDSRIAIPNSWTQPADKSQRAGDSPILNPSPLARQKTSKWEMLLAPVVVGQLQLLAPARAKPGAAGAGAPKGNVVTIAQFEQASQIAKLAADNGLNELSVKAMMQGLQAGPPIESMQALDLTQPFPAARANQNSDQSQLSQRVEERIALIEQVWRQKGFADDIVYDVLKTAVLPESRPFEVFLYPRPLTSNPSQPPQSVGSLLVKAAAKAGKVDELKALIEPRLKQPLGELSGRVLLAQLALATRDNVLANEQMELLSKRLQQDSLQFSNELACHVAIPALSSNDLPPAAIALLERTLGHFTQNAIQNQGRVNTQEEPMRSFRFALARIYFQQDNPQAGKKHLEEYLNFLTPIYSRYGGDYGQYRRRVELMKVAAEYARAGQRADALDCLGRHADLPANRNYGQEGTGRAVATILSGLATLPAAERYELLKSWTLPTTDRKSVRMIAGMMPGDNAPESFDTLRGAATRGPAEPRLMSTADLLVSAAAEAKQLDALKQELQPHADQNVEYAKFLLLLTRAAAEDGSAVVPALRQYVDERKAVATAPNVNQNPAQLADIILARNAITNPKLVGLGRELAMQFITHASRLQDHPMMTLGRREYFAPVLGGVAADRMDHQPWNTGLKHWTAGAVVSARSEASGAVPMWWIAHEGLIGHLCGPDDSHLYLKYPLTGEFDITCDSWLGGWGENDLGYGGMVYNGLNLGSDTQIFPVGNRRDSLHKPDPPDVRERYNQVRLEIRKEKVRYFVNETLIHEEPQSTATAPWMLVHCNRVWYTVIRNLRLSGQITIPREVSLVEKNSLLGWVTEFYGETQPNRDTNRAEAADNGQQAAIQEFDWAANDGIIRGRLQPNSSLGKTTVQQSRLHYDRPLLDGERIRYEFWYEPGPAGTDVAPALDRLTFLLQTDGVKLHWMTDGSALEDNYGGLATDNVLVDPSIQREKIALKERDWNAVELSLKNHVVAIRLNGTLVCERPLEPTNSCQFGFYHDKNATAARIRNVVMSGDWPESFTPQIQSDLLASARELSLTERRGLSLALDEKFHAGDVEQLLKRTRKLPADEQYAVLKNWVLPNEDHASTRLYGGFTVETEIPIGNRLWSARLDADAATSTKPVRRQMRGGELYAPAFDLVALSKKLNRLDELSQQVSQIPGDSPQAVRAKLSMKILIEIAQRNFDQTNRDLNDLLTLCAAIQEDAPMMDRWPEALVGDEATHHPQLRRNALPILSRMVDHLRNKGIGDPWASCVNGLRDHCRALVEAEQYPIAGGSSPKGQWIHSRMDWSDSQGRGPMVRWQFRDDGVTHLGGDSHDYLYFQSPLRGSFTVESELSTYGWREMRLMYHTNWVGPQYTHTAVDLGNLTSSWNSPQIDPRVEFGDWCNLKMVAEPGKATFFINEQQVHLVNLPEQADPWIALMTWGNLSGGARSVRITGKPEIPEELNLSSRADLSGWTGHYYHDPVSNDDNSAWVKADTEIVGKKFDPNPGRKRQSLLRYHRPLVEDSVVNYDFYYDPQQTHVHPALGRMAFMLLPEGVKIHWLTDAQWDRSELAPDNVSIDKSAQRGPATLPLKANDWNHLRLTLVGDTVKLNLNDVEVYEATIDSANQRRFGLFHYADETDVRVKNVVYRGDWPKTLPSLKEQELSGQGAQAYLIDEAELETQLNWDFHGAKPSFLAVWGGIQPNRMEEVPEGLKIVRGENASPDAIPCGFQWSTDLKGDFEVTLKFREFESRTEQTDWQIPRIEMYLDIGGNWGAPDNTHMMQIGLRRQPDNRLTVYSGLGLHTGDKYDWKFSHNESKINEGRLRVTRIGHMAYFLYAKGDSDEWIQLNKGPISDAPLKGGNFTLRAEMATSSGEAVFTDFTVKSRTARIVPAGPPPYEFADGELKTKFAWDFQGPKPSFLKLFGAMKPNRMEPLADGLKLVRGEKAPADATLCGFLWSADIKGDFEATIGFRDFQSKTDQQDWQVPRIEAQFDIGGGWNDPQNTNVLQAGLRRPTNGKLTLFAVNRIHKGEEYQNKSSTREVQETTGRLRIVRKGETAYYLLSKPDSKDWTLLYQGPVSSAPLKGGNFGFRGETPTSSGDVVLTEFVLKAAESAK